MFHHIPDFTELRPPHIIHENSLNRTSCSEGSHKAGRHPHEPIHTEQSNIVGVSTYIVSAWITRRGGHL